MISELEQETRELELNDEKNK